MSEEREPIEGNARNGEPLDANQNGIFDTIEDLDKTPSSVWRLGPAGRLISSTTEWHAARFAGWEDGVIYFFAELVPDAAQ